MMFSVPIWGLFNLTRREMEVHYERKIPVVFRPHLGII